MTNSIPDFSGTHALVTGASRGIGKAISIALAQAGAHVIAVARTSGGLEELDDEIRDIGGAATLVPMDLTDDEGIEQLAGALANRFGKLDFLIANAASLGELAPLPDIEPKVWRHTLDLNLSANWRLLRALDPILRAAPSAHVAFLTSRVGGEMARPYWGAYAVSKAGLEMLARTYAEEVSNLNIHVSIIDPGAMRTKMRAQAMPGEDPNDLPAPEALTPLIYEMLQNSGDELKRVTFRDWSQKKQT